jgi:hypothetical protein
VSRNTRAQNTVTEPWMLEPFEWLTAAEYALRIHRPYSTVSRWCRDGTFHDFSVPTYRSPNGRWWVRGIPTP